MWGVCGVGGGPGVTVQWRVSSTRSARNTTRQKNNTTHALKEADVRARAAKGRPAEQRKLLEDVHVSDVGVGALRLLDGGAVGGACRRDGGVGVFVGRQSGGRRRRRAGLLLIGHCQLDVAVASVLRGVALVQASARRSSGGGGGRDDRARLHIFARGHVSPLWWRGQRA